MELLERFLKYVKIDTMSSNDNEGITPSTNKQYNLANILNHFFEEEFLVEMLLINILKFGLLNHMD